MKPYIAACAVYCRCVSGRLATPTGCGGSHGDAAGGQSLGGGSEDRVSAWPPGPHRDTPQTSATGMWDDIVLVFFLPLFLSLYLCIALSLSLSLSRSPAAPVSHPHPLLLPDQTHNEVAAGQRDQAQETRSHTRYVDSSHTHIHPLDHVIKRLTLSPQRVPMRQTREMPISSPTPAASPAAQSLPHSPPPRPAAE